MEELEHAVEREDWRLVRTRLLESLAGAFSGQRATASRRFAYLRTRLLRVAAFAPIWHVASGVEAMSSANGAKGGIS